MARVPAIFVAALSLVIVTAISGLSYALLIRPLYQQYLRQESVIGEQSTVLELLSLNKNDPADYAQKIAAYRSEIADVDGQLPTVESAAELMNKAIAEASSHGLHFQSVEQAKAKTKREYSVLPTHVVMMGRYIDLLNWLYWISNSHSAIQLEKVDLTVFSANEEKSVLAAELDFEIYTHASSGFGLSKNWSGK